MGQRNFFWLSMLHRDDHTKLQLLLFQTSSSPVWHSELRAVLDVHENPIPNCLRWRSWTATISDSLSNTWLSRLLALAWTRLGLSPPRVVNVRNQAKDTLQTRSTTQQQESFKDLYCRFSRCTGVTQGTDNTSKIKLRNENAELLQVRWSGTERKEGGLNTAGSGQGRLLHTTEREGGSTEGKKTQT